MLQLPLRHHDAVFCELHNTFQISNPLDEHCPGAAAQMRALLQAKSCSCVESHAPAAVHAIRFAGPLHCALQLYCRQAPTTDSHQELQSAHL